MRRRYYTAAQALRAFLARDESDRDWSGALIVADALDDLKAIRRHLDNYAKSSRKRRRR